MNDMPEKIWMHKETEQAKTMHPPGLGLGLFQEYTRTDIHEALKAQIPQWISVDERLPTEADDRLVMVRDDSGRYNYIESRFVAPNSDEITHWMPVPKIKGEDEWL